MTAFRGTYTVLITPFGEDGRSVDLAALERLVDWQIAEGIHGLIPLGSTGEFLSLSDEEKTAVAETVIRTARGRVPVLIGTGAETTPDVIRYTREAERLGADGVMIIPPFYSTPTEDELYHHFKLVGDATSLPIMIYNNPATANVDMKPPLVARLSTIDNVSYIKESTLEVTRVRDIIRLCGDRMTVFAGILGYESFWLGAEGWVAVCSNLIPRASADLFTLVADKQDWPAARELYYRMVPILEWVGGHRYVAGTKAALGMMGMPVGTPRSPRLALPDADLPTLRAVLTEFGALPARRKAGE